MRLIDADALTNEIERRRKAAKTLTGVDMIMLIENTKTAVGEWISVNDRLPENAQHKGAFCPKYLVCTEYGITEGWYNPDRGCWYTLVMFLIGRKTRDDIDMERGDIPAITNSISVTHWMPLPEPPKGGK